MVLYFEDLEAGMELRTPGRTITEADLVTFAMHSGDWNPIHVDRVHAAANGFGRPVVHGMCGMAVMGGLIYAGGWFTTTTVALLEFGPWRFTAPIFAGDTVHCRLRVDGLRVTSSGQHGVVERHLSLWNQDGRCVQEGPSRILIRLREPRREQTRAEEE